MSNPIGEIKTGVSGKYRIQVLEHPLLKELRKRALLETSGQHTDGTTESWKQLDGYLAVDANARLAQLVSENLESLEDGEIVHDTGFHPNLILDSGLNYLCGTFTNGSIADTYDCGGLFGKGRLGVGTTDVVIDSGAITAAASGTTVTSSAPFFTTEMVGQLIKWDSGDERYITAYNTTSEVVVSASSTATGTFAVWAVNQTALGSLSSTTNTGKHTLSVSRSGGVSSVTSGWDFPIETGNKIYTEGGITVFNTTTYWSRFMISGGSVTVLIGQQARLYYVLSMALSTTSPVSTTWTLDSYDSGSPGGWDSPTGQFQACGVWALDGLAQYYEALLLPGSSAVVDLSTVSTLVTYADEPSSATHVSGAIGSSVRTSLLPYSSGTFYRDCQVYFSPTYCNTTSIRSVFFSSYGHIAWQFLFDSAKTKDNLHSLTLKVRRSFQRTLTNP